MSSRTRLTDAQIDTALQELAGWQRDGDFLRRDVTFADFDEAMAFWNKAADIARVLDHHPDWSNVYNRISIRVQTHDAGGITALDVEWARRANALLG